MLERGIFVPALGGIAECIVQRAFEVLGKAWHMSCLYRDSGGIFRHRQGVIWQSKVNLRSEEHTSELQSLMRISYAVFCLKKKKTYNQIHNIRHITNCTSYNIKNH